MIEGFEVFKTKNQSQKTLSERIPCETESGMGWEGLG